MTFEPAFDASQPTGDRDLWFLVHEEKLVVRKSPDGYAVPRYSDVKDLRAALDGAQYFGRRDGRSCFLASVPEPELLGDGFELTGILTLLGQLDDELLMVAGCAAQLVRWDRCHRYCGRCGVETVDEADERARICPGCGLRSYPRLSPAVIVAVVRGDELLLATSPRFRARFWSVLAGFVEPGETLEQCVVREVQEEVGISVRNVRYFDSQPWPFPDSLMIGFTAEYAAGEIETDGEEIAEAAWFSADALPSIPPKLSIARRLIDWFVHDGGRGTT